MAHCSTFEYGRICPQPPSKERQKWTEAEHGRFEEALHLFDRDWRSVEKHMCGSKSVIQIRSHAQKHFQRVLRQSGEGTVPPARVKRKAGHNVDVGTPPATLTRLPCQDVACTGPPYDASSHCHVATVTATAYDDDGDVNGNDCARKSVRSDTSSAAAETAAPPPLQDMTTTWTTMLHRTAPGRSNPWLLPNASCDMMAGLPREVRYQQQQANPWQPTSPQPLAARRELSPQGSHVASLLELHHLPQLFQQQQQLQTQQFRQQWQQQQDVSTSVDTECARRQHQQLPHQHASNSTSPPAPEQACTAAPSMYVAYSYVGSLFDPLFSQADHSAALENMATFDRAATLEMLGSVTQQIASSCQRKLSTSRQETHGASVPSDYSFVDSDTGSGCFHHQATPDQEQPQAGLSSEGSGERWW